MRTNHTPQPLFAPTLAGATSLCLPLCLLLCSAAQAQTASSTTAAPAASAAAAAKPAPEQTTRHIVVEDASTRIDEVRVGSETKSITVKPKSDMPAYDVAPASGERTWKVLGF